MTHSAANRPNRHPALTTRLSAACRDPRHHCTLVLAVNAGLVACAAAEPFTPALALHLVLMPVNACRMLHALCSGCPARRLAVSPPGFEVQAARERAASMRHPAFEACATMQTIRLGPRASQ